MSGLAFFVRPSSQKNAYRIEFDRKVRFDINAIVRRLETMDEYDVLMYTPFICVVRTVDDVEITLSRRGNFTIRNVNSPDKAKEIAEKFLEIAWEESQPKK